MPHALAGHIAALRLDSPMLSPASGGLTAAAAAVKTVSESSRRTVRRAVTSSLLAASGGGSAPLAVAVAVVPPSDAAAVAASASAAGVLFTAKALPMADTLLKRLSSVGLVGGRRGTSGRGSGGRPAGAAEPLGTPASAGGGTVDGQPQSLGDVTSMVVDDCLAFVQVRVAAVCQRRQPAASLPPAARVAPHV